MYFSFFLYALEYCYSIHSYPLPCLFKHAQHCEVGVINRHAGNLGLCSAVAGAQISGRGANMPFNLFTWGPHAGIKAPQAA